MVKVIRTAIFVEDETEFRIFLESEGFTNFHLFPASGDKLYLNIQFDHEPAAFNYKLRGVEEEFRSMRSNTYYYDLDSDFDDEAQEFFGDDSDYI